MPRRRRRGRRRRGARPSACCVRYRLRFLLARGDPVPIAVTREATPSYSPGTCPLFLGRRERFREREIAKPPGSRRRWWSRARGPRRWRGHTRLPSLPDRSPQVRAGRRARAVVGDLGGRRDTSTGDRAAAATWIVSGSPIATRPAEADTYGRPCLETALLGEDALLLRVHELHEIGRRRKLPTGVQLRDLGVDPFRSTVVGERDPVVPVEHEVRVAELVGHDRRKSPYGNACATRRIAPGTPPRRGRNDRSKSRRGPRSR